MIRWEGRRTLQEIIVTPSLAASLSGDNSRAINGGQNMVGIGAEAEAEEDSDAIDCLEMI